MKHNLNDNSFSNTKRTIFFPYRCHDHVHLWQFEEENIHYITIRFLLKLDQNIYFADFTKLSIDSNKYLKFDKIRLILFYMNKVFQKEKVITIYIFLKKYIKYY